MPGTLTVFLLYLVHTLGAEDHRASKEKLEGKGRLSTQELVADRNWPCLFPISSKEAEEVAKKKRGLIQKIGSFYPAQGAQVFLACKPATKEACERIKPIAGIGPSVLRPNAREGGQPNGKLLTDFEIRSKYPSMRSDNLSCQSETIQRYYNMPVIYEEKKSRVYTQLPAPTGACIRISTKGSRRYQCADRTKVWIPGKNFGELLVGVGEAPVTANLCLRSGDLMRGMGTADFAPMRFLPGFSCDDIDRISQLEERKTPQKELQELLKKDPQTRKEIFKEKKLEAVPLLYSETGRERDKDWRKIKLTHSLQPFYFKPEGFGPENLSLSNLRKQWERFDLLLKSPAKK